MQKEQTGVMTEDGVFVKDWQYSQGYFETTLTDSAEHAAYVSEEHWEKWRDSFQKELQQRCYFVRITITTSVEIIPSS